MRNDVLNGQLDALILATVADEPAHGYVILQRLRSRSSGAFDLAERRREWEMFSGAVEAVLG